MYFLKFSYDLLNLKGIMLLAIESFIKTIERQEQTKISNSHFFILYLIETAVERDFNFTFMETSFSTSMLHISLNLKICCFILTRAVQ